MCASVGSEQFDEIIYAGAERAQLPQIDAPGLVPTKGLHIVCHHFTAQNTKDTEDRDVPPKSVIILLPLLAVAGTQAALLVPSMPNC